MSRKAALAESELHGTCRWQQDPVRPVSLLVCDEGGVTRSGCRTKTRKRVSAHVGQVGGKNKNGLCPPSAGDIAGGFEGGIQTRSTAVLQGQCPALSSHLQGVSVGTCNDAAGQIAIAARYGVECSQQQCCVQCTAFGRLEQFSKSRLSRSQAAGRYDGPMAHRTQDRRRRSETASSATRRDFSRELMSVSVAMTTCPSEAMAGASDASWASMSQPSTRRP